MNRKTVQSIAIIAIFITGALLLFYPLVSNWWNERRYDMLVSGYTQRVQVNPSGEDYAEFKRIDAYNATVPGKGVPDAFAVTTPEEDAEYASFLNEDPNGVMAYINIPDSNPPCRSATTPHRNRCRKASAIYVAPPCPSAAKTRTPCSPHTAACRPHACSPTLTR